MPLCHYPKAPNSPVTFPSLTGSLNPYTLNPENPEPPQTQTNLETFLNLRTKFKALNPTVLHNSLKEAQTCLLLPAHEPRSSGLGVIESKANKFHLLKPECSRYPEAHNSSTIRLGLKANRDSEIKCLKPCQTLSPKLCNLANKARGRRMLGAGSSCRW